MDLDGAETLWGLPFVRLEDGLSFEPLLGRPRDREHVRIVRAPLGGGAAAGEP